MQKVSIIISVVTAIIFIAIIILSGGSVIDINAASIGPVSLALMFVYLGCCDINFKKSGKDMLHPNESDFTYSERVDFYKARGILLLSGCVAQIFLIFCFGELLKTLVCTLAFLFSFGIASFFAGREVSSDVKARMTKEEAELKAQIAAEEQGKL